MKNILALSFLFVAAPIFTMQQPPVKQAPGMTKDEFMKHIVATVPLITCLPPMVSVPLLVTQYAIYKGLEAQGSRCSGQNNKQ